MLATSRDDRRLDGSPRTASSINDDRDALASVSRVTRIVAAPEPAGMHKPLALVTEGCHISRRECTMSKLARIEIDEDVADAAKRRAAEQGLSVTEYISVLLRRSFERNLDEESILVYDHVGGTEFDIDRDPGEDDESYNRRVALFRDLFGHGV
jgi:hypothetical protein